MSQKIADVALIYDRVGPFRNAVMTLKRSFKLKAVDLSREEALQHPVGRAPVFCLDKFPAAMIAQIEAICAEYVAPPLFILPTYNADTFERAKAFGGEPLVPPVDDHILTESVRRSVNMAVEYGWKDLKPAEAKALKTSVDCFRSLFKAASKGERMPLDQVAQACGAIQDSIGDSSIDRWLSSLKQHHDVSFRHSMFVCGTLTYFSHAVGIAGDDLRDLTWGGFLHDAGKARVPLEILDKPGKLDDEDWAIMAKHPEYSREILSVEEGVTPDIVAMATSHHEKLDGTGYPDGLVDAQLNDFVRLVSIADVFSALTEPRAYKDPMSNEAALDIISGFKGHLDLALVKRFREFILDNDEAAAA